MRSSSKKSIINEFIEADEVRLVAADGSQVGVVSIEEARDAAAKAKLAVLHTANPVAITAPAPVDAPANIVPANNFGI